MNELELYVNKKFDVLKVIKMVLKRKGWGESYTLYSTPTHEVITSMINYNFKSKYATFEIKINEKAGSGYYQNTLNIYTDREDYTLSFVNKLLLKTIKSYLKNYRTGIFESESYNLYPWISYSSKSQKKWIEQFDLQDKVNEIEKLSLDDKEIEGFIETLVDKYISEYEEEVCYKPRRIYQANAEESDREPQILALIDEIDDELEKCGND